MRCIGRRRRAHHLSKGEWWMNPSIYTKGTRVLKTLLGVRTFILVNPSPSCTPNRARTKELAWRLESMRYRSSRIYKATQLFQYMIIPISVAAVYAVPRWTLHCNKPSRPHRHYDGWKLYRSVGAWIETTWSNTGNCWRQYTPEFRHGVFFSFRFFRPQPWSSLQHKRKQHRPRHIPLDEIPVTRKEIWKLRRKRGEFAQLIHVSTRTHTLQLDLLRKSRDQIHWEQKHTSTQRKSSNNILWTTLKASGGRVDTCQYHEKARQTVTKQVYPKETVDSIRQGSSAGSNKFHRACSRTLRWRSRHAWWPVRVTQRSKHFQ